MIHISKIPQLMERKDARGNPLPFSLKYVKKSTGETISIKGAVLTSSFQYGGTINIMVLSSGETRKLILPLVTEFNNTEVYL